MVQSNQSISKVLREIVSNSEPRKRGLLYVFLPLLLFYLLIILIFSVNGLHTDEPRYLMYADNILHGAFTDPDDPNLMNAPGYPLYLAIFLGLGLPLIVPKLLNAILMAGAVYFLYKTLKIYLSEKASIISSYLLGLYYPMFAWIIYNISEAFSIFLISAFIYFTIRCVRGSKMPAWKLLLPAFLLGYLILTKLFFQYVVLFTLVFALIGFVVRRRRMLARFIGILAVGYLIAAVPWLTYTYSLTGKPFLWGTQTGQKIYWMTTSYEGESGKWYQMESVLKGKFPELHPDHRTLFATLEGKNHMEVNEILIDISKENIKNNPGNYMYKIIPNTLRLFFAHPMHLRPSINMYIYAVINTLLLLPFLFSLIPAWINRHSIPMELYWLLLFAAFYIGGLCLIPTVPRYLFMAIPFVLLWTAYVLDSYVELSVKKVLVQQQT